jgi:hypothetical protein
MGEQLEALKKIEAKLDDLLKSGKRMSPESRLRLASALALTRARINLRLRRPDFEEAMDQRSPRPPRPPLNSPGDK